MWGQRLTISMDRDVTRRRILGAGTTLGLAAIAGCTGSSDDAGSGGTDEPADDQTDDSADGTGGTDADTGGDGIPATDGDPDVLTFEGELADFDGEPGPIMPDLVHTNDTPEIGHLEEDGQFSISIEAADLEPEEGVTVGGDDTTLVDSLNIRCRDDVDESIDEAARFTWFTHLRIAAFDRDDVSFITAMSDPGCEPSFANCPEAEAVYVTWLYSTHALTVTAECDGQRSQNEAHEIDVDLQEGWNLLLQDEQDRSAQTTVSIDSLETAFESVDWYYNDQ